MRIRRGLGEHHRLNVRDEHLGIDHHRTSSTEVYDTGHRTRNLQAAQHPMTSTVSLFLSYMTDIDTSRHNSCKPWKWPNGPFDGLFRVKSRWDGDRGLAAPISGVYTFPSLFSPFLFPMNEL